MLKQSAEVSGQVQCAGLWNSTLQFFFSHNKNRKTITKVSSSLFHMVIYLFIYLGLMRLYQRFHMDPKNVLDEVFRVHLVWAIHPLALSQKYCHLLLLKYKFPGYVANVHIHCLLN